MFLVFLFSLASIEIILVYFITFFTSAAIKTYKNILSLCCFYINLKIKCEIIAT